MSRWSVIFQMFMFGEGLSVAMIKPLYLFRIYHVKLSIHSSQTYELYMASHCFVLVQNGYTHPKYIFIS